MVGSHRQWSLMWDIYFQAHSDRTSGFPRAAPLIRKRQNYFAGSDDSNVLY